MWMDVAYNYNFVHVIIPALALCVSVLLAHRRPNHRASNFSPLRYRLY